MSKPFLLIATIRLTIHGGVEEAIGYIGRGLVERGWRVAVYAPALGPEAERLSKDLEIVSGLANLDGVPNLIHGLQHTALVPCLIRFPDTPAIHICHSADPVSWADRAVTFERIRRHAAVDEACRDRIVLEAGIARDRIALLPNAVDLNRFKPRAPLPARPRRALIVANRRFEHVAPIQEACHAAGLQTEIVGNAVDRETCGIEDALERIDALSRVTIREHRDAKPVDREREAREFATYLSEWLPSGPHKSPFFAQIRMWQSRAGYWRGQFEKLTAELGGRGIAVKPPTGDGDQMP